MPSPMPDRIMAVFQDKLGDRAPAYIHGALQQTVMHFLDQRQDPEPPEDMCLVEQYAWLQEASAQLSDAVNERIGKLEHELSELRAVRSAMDSCGSLDRTEASGR